MQASYSGGLSCCRAQALGRRRRESQLLGSRARASGVAAPGSRARASGVAAPGSSTQAQ